MNSDGFKEAELFTLTEKVKDKLFLEIEDQRVMKPIHGKKMTDTIAAKKMFYQEKTAAQVDELTDLLIGKNFKSVQERLSQEGMRTGFACLF